MVAARPSDHKKKKVDKKKLEDVEVNQSNWQIWPHLRWGFQNMASVLPVLTVKRSLDAGDSDDSTTQKFLIARPSETIQLDRVELPPWAGSATALEYLDSVHTDAFLVVHKKRLVCEQYFGNQTADTLHITQSITKSLCALTASCCFNVLDRKDEELTSSLLPELVGSGYEGSTVRHLLDMTCATKFSEHYADPSSPAGGHDMTGLCVAMQWHPSSESGDASDSSPEIRHFLKGLRKKDKQQHGRTFDYQSTTSECLCWATEAAVGGRSPGTQFEELLSKHIWSRLGQEQDANITVDSAGVCGVSGGLSCTPRDLARVGQILVDGGRNMSGEQIVPKDFLDDCLSPDASAYARYSDEDPYGQAYRNNFWIFGKDPSDASYMGYGIHGQVLWAHPKEELVVVKLASSEDPMNDFEYAVVMEILLAIRSLIQTAET